MFVRSYEVQLFREYRTLNRVFGRHLDKRSQTARKTVSGICHRCDGSRVLIFGCIAGSRFRVEFKSIINIHSEKISSGFYVSVNEFTW